MRIIGVLLLFVLVSCQEPKSAKQPNVIILLADDLGYGDLSCYGSPSIHTPHIDELSRGGTLFTQFYTGSAVCSPSRACLLTGKFPLRFDIRRHFSDHGEHLPASAFTLPEFLKDQNYHTVHVGKWHLGGLRLTDIDSSGVEGTSRGPLEHGFTHSLTNVEGAPIRPRLIKERKLYREGGDYLIRNNERIPPIKKHWTEIKIDEALAQVEKAKELDKPFFLNLWFDVPHTPYEPAPEPHLSKYEKMGVTGDQLYFRSMVSHLDAQIGRLMAHLEESGDLENTLIIFTSDNGPAFQGSSGPFKGGKTDLHEGGIRVPFMVKWEGVLPENKRSAEIAHMADLFPTIMEAVTGQKEKADFDGISLLSHFKNQDALAPRRLFWQMDLYKFFQNQGPKPTPYATTVVMENQTKVLADSATIVARYDLLDDMGEWKNLVGKDKSVDSIYQKSILEFLSEERDRSGFEY